MKNKGLETDYPLIPMSEITDEAREIAVAWGDEYFPGIAMPEKHKLASDIMNYARRYASSLQPKEAEQPVDKQIEKHFKNIKRIQFEQMAWQRYPTISKEDFEDSNMSDMTYDKYCFEQEKWRSIFIEGAQSTLSTTPIKVEQPVVSDEGLMEMAEKFWKENSDWNFIGKGRDLQKIEYVTRYDFFEFIESITKKKSL